MEKTKPLIIISLDLLGMGGLIMQILMHMFASLFLMFFVSVFSIAATPQGIPATDNIIMEVVL